ncbi:MAG TPA: hypothetical protein VKQ73_12015 [Stellaceae bacterium]|nr:hypothetical protein [Stellaceae bacterium]
MKHLALAAAVICGSALLWGQPAQAAGCVKGAVVGGVAGHYVAHHGLLGAAVGCAIGHHEARKHYRDRDQRYDADNR